MAEEHTVPAICHVCGREHPAHPVSDREAEAIAEDAQTLADYYRMTEHDDPRGEGRCDGSRKTPGSLVHEEDDGDCLDPGDIEEADSAYDAHYAERYR